MTIDKALENPEVNLLDRQRLIDFSRNWFAQLDHAKQILLP